jgi:hypothetical protein
MKRLIHGAGDSRFAALPQTESRAECSPVSAGPRAPTDRTDGVLPHCGKKSTGGFL